MDVADNITTKDKHIKRKKIKIKTKTLIVSDSLSSFPEKKRKKLDLSGKLAEKIIVENGYVWQGIEYLPDELNEIRDFIIKNSENDLDLILTIGGTGVAKRDITIEAIEPILSKFLPGFGELFRHLTYTEIGTVSMMTRAIAGIINETIIVCLPGSPNAVEMGLNLIMKEIIHIKNHL